MVEGVIQSMTGDDDELFPMIGNTKSEAHNEKVTEIEKKEKRHNVESVCVCLPAYVFHPSKA